MRDIDMNLEQLEEKYGPLTYRERCGYFVDSGDRIRRIAHTRANIDLMDEMEDGLIFDSLYDDFVLTMEELEEKYGELTLTKLDYYVDKDGIVRRILPYTPLAR